MSAQSDLLHPSHRPNAPLRSVGDSRKGRRKRRRMKMVKSLLLRSVEGERLCAQARAWGFPTFERTRAISHICSQSRARVCMLLPSAATLAHIAHIANLPGDTAALVPPATGDLFPSSSSSSTTTTTTTPMQSAAATVGVREIA